MVKRLLRVVRHGLAALGRFSGRLLGEPSEGPAFAEALAGSGAAVAVALRSRSSGAFSIAPATVETRFMRLHMEGRFDEMWELLAADAQRAWGGRESFAREMPRLDEWMQILELQVVSVTMLDSWTDHVHQRMYANVARLVMRYHVRQQGREWVFERQVHLVLEGGEWRTLCYPTRVRNPSGR